MWTRYLVLVIGLTACSSSAPSGTTVTCAQTMDSFCATASPKCARQLDPKDPLGSFCKASSPGTSVGIANCQSGRIIVYVDVGADKQFWEYDATTHQLVTISDRATKACIAGPASYTGTTEICKSNLVAYQCGTPIVDGGIDGAADAKPD